MPERSRPPVAITVIMWLVCLSAFVGLLLFFVGVAPNFFCGWLDEIWSRLCPSWLRATGASNVATWSWEHGVILVLASGVLFVLLVGTLLGLNYLSRVVRKKNFYFK